MDISLYKLALNIERPPSPLLVSPTTLLSLAESVIEVLVEQQISATIWLKLPPGKIWYSAIKRYHEQVKVSHTTYVCHTQKVLKGHIAGEGFPIVPVQLVPNSQLRRDYFLLILSPQFSSLILAHRSRMRRQKKARTKENHQNQKKIMPLLSVCSFEEQTIQGVLDGLKHSITQSTRLTLAQPQSQTINTDLLKNWDCLFSFSAAPNPVLIEQLLAKQIQQQDAVRRSVISQRITTLQQQNQQLLETLNRKNEFFNSMCEELRTPLTHMKAALSLLNSPHLKPPQKQRYLQLLSTECDRQNSLINGLLELVQMESSAEQTVLVPLRLSEIVPGVVSTYQPLAQEKGIMLAYTVSTDLPAVYCSPAWIRQVVINLLHNSIKFTHSGGQVWVKASVQGDYVQLEFRDTGIGVSPNEIPKIFDRFYRVRSASSDDPSGAGLGLTIVQQLLLLCGGSISVKSKPGEGSIFNVLLAIAPSTGGSRE
jgi:signal transduction histidine kinase